MINKVELVGVLQPTIAIREANPEGLMAYAARVSSNNQDQNNKKVLDYCKEHKHWSVFEMGAAMFAISAPRDITRQILRHRSLHFQEFSQRYSDKISFTEREMRRQDTKNRQNSFDDLLPSVKEDAEHIVSYTMQSANRDYENLRGMGIAKETARTILPEGLTMSHMLVMGTPRDWYHYCQVRMDPSTQREHRLIATKVNNELAIVYPSLFKKVKNV